MQSASLAPADRRRAPLRRRWVALLLVLAIHLGLVFVLVMLAPPQAPRSDAAPGMKVFELRAPAPKIEPKPARAKRKIAGAAARSPAKAPAPPVARTKTPPTPPTEKFGTLLFDAIDITKLPNHRAELAAGPPAPGGGAGDSGVGRDSETVDAGGGPNGEPLYQAEWVTEPTNAELSFYLPKSIAQDSWAMIICRTIERNRVDDCRQLGDSPPGSGLARGVQQAAWQFRVRPPRVGGHALVGAWVRIRIDFSQGPAR